MFSCPKYYSLFLTFCSTIEFNPYLHLLNFYFFIILVLMASSIYYIDKPIYMYMCISMFHVAIFIMYTCFQSCDFSPEKLIRSEIKVYIFLTRSSANLNWSLFNIQGTFTKSELDVKLNLCNAISAFNTLSLSCDLPI